MTKNLLRVSVRFAGPRLVCAVALLCLAMPVTSPAQFNTLVNFDGTNGYESYYMSPVQGTDGNLYGATEYGGAHGEGTVFKVTPAGGLTTLYSFCAQTACTDGASPVAGLVLGRDGYLYGETAQGGLNAKGTVFRITSAGTLTTLHSFVGDDGAEPYGGLVQATNGSFYGTTNGGGASGQGTVFGITSRGTLTTLHSFAGPDGSGPIGGLVQATNGDLYGTTALGGAYGNGTVFSITSGGTLTTLYSFGDFDGSGPYAALVQAANGTFYGTTRFGGPYQDGTVFSLTGNTLTTLYSFCSKSESGVCTDGTYPTAPLVHATNGYFYGTTISGGANNNGTVFSITSEGALTTLHSFVASVDGELPYGGLVQATNGTLYGTTYEGGANGDGTIFELGVGLRPFVKTLPTSGKLAAPVTILGTNLTGATGVTFNGTAASFTVISSSEITTTVPTGATTGKVQVKTPGATLSSNVPFSVRQ